MPIVIDPKKLDLQGAAGMQLVEILRNLADNLVPGITYIDTELSITSKNPVQNNVITKAINSMLSANKLQVEAESIPSGSSAYINKAIDPISGFVTLVFGIPEGTAGPRGPAGTFAATVTDETIEILDLRLVTDVSEVGY